MKKFEVSINYTINNETKIDTFNVTANGKDKAINVATKSFNAKHKKDNVEIINTSLKQTLDEEKDMI